MYDTPERVRRVEKRLLEGQRRKRRRSVYRLGALCAGVCALLVGVLSAVTKRQPVSASGTFGAMQVHAGAGGYVLAAVASFALSSALTLACVRLREQGRQSETKDREKAEPPSADQ